MLGNARPRTIGEEAFSALDVVVVDAPAVVVLVRDIFNTKSSQANPQHALLLVRFISAEDISPRSLKAFSLQVLYMAASTANSEAYLEEQVFTLYQMNWEEGRYSRFGSHRVEQPA